MRTWPWICDMECLPYIIVIRKFRAEECFTYLFCCKNHGNALRLLSIIINGKVTPIVLSMWIGCTS